MSEAGDAPTGGGAAAPPGTAKERHEAAQARFEAARAALDRRVSLYGVVQLLLFLGVAVLGGTGAFQRDTTAALGALGLFVLFMLVRVFGQGRALRARDGAEVRRDVHDRHLARIEGRWRALPDKGEGLFGALHPYASDLDLSGEGSLFQRLSVTHTQRGAETLATWLGAPATAEVVTARQEAVRELAGAFELRQELEAAVLETGRDRLDARPFLQLARQKGILERAPMLGVAAWVLPPITVTLGILGWVGVIPSYVWLVPLAAAIFAQRSKASEVAETYAAFSSRRRSVEAFLKLFRVVEAATFEAPALEAIRSRLQVGGKPPTALLGRLSRWASLFELREQGLVHFFLDPLLLWDLNCLRGIERWNREVGREAGPIFDALGELEALASLSILLDQDPDARFPELSADRDAPFDATGLGHPLLPASSRVKNDLRLRGPGTVTIITGSNMAGKSTLLRSVGVNLALALAGGPVVADALSCPTVRLRTSMRIADSLQSGASYFQAELFRLRIVVADAELEPPVFFLLDELLRGTNARARHLGARAVVEHLLERGATGLVATHDVALAALEDERPEEVANHHFTDVFEDGEMTFDYRLRPGVVKTSNALRLLSAVGIRVPDDSGLVEMASEQVSSAP